jgi:copper chaperone NosL
MRTTSRARARASRVSGPLVCLLLFTFCLLPASCGPKRNAPVAENATYGYCPVCGMEVNAGDAWASEIRYNDGTKLMFESPGDMLAFYTSPTRYNVNDWLKEKQNIKKVLLKDYNTREPIDAANAELVVKSRMDGPMGPDFFPFSTRQAAEIFAGTNGGTVLRLADVTVEIVRELGRN